LSRCSAAVPVVAPRPRRCGTSKAKPDDGDDHDQRYDKRTAHAHCGHIGSKAGGLNVLTLSVRKI
ncbi:MAG: hypothetical protein QOK42_2681, partial [Frankiaceae bacterium]|nr:hypothetical protein [Frankiaceae bacterium]